MAEIGHGSPFEHVTFTFGIEGVSRALTHQLVRHRIASYSQKSQRYVTENQFGYVIPDTIKNNNDMLEAYDKLMAQIQEFYDIAVENGVPKEDARYVLPNATETSIIVTMNARSLFNFFAHRCCTRAQWEIRLMAHKMLQLVKEVAPETFKKSGANCIKLGYCPEGKMSCGAFHTLEEIFNN